MGLMDLFKPKWKHSDPGVRKAAVEQIQDQSILAKIAKEDPEVEVCQAAARALRKIEAKDFRNNESVLKLFDLLDQGENQERYWATTALGGVEEFGCDAQETKLLLTSAIEKGESGIDFRAEYSLKRIEGRHKMTAEQMATAQSEKAKITKSIDELLTELVTFSSDVDAKRDTIKQLRVLGKPKSVGPLVDIVCDFNEHDYVRDEAATALALFGIPFGMDPKDF